MVANIGDGEKAAEKTGDTGMVASSPSSPRRGRRSTTKTESLTPAQAIEILQQALVECQQAGIEIKPSTIYSNGHQTLAIFVVDAVLDGGNLRYIGGK